MTPAQLQTIEEIFYAALDQEPDKVARFLETTCGGDELLRGEVEALLASRQRVGSFIETSAVGIASRIIENGQADLLVGQTFGHYKISKPIGSGGMGEVYLATDITAGRKAALKLLPLRFTGDAERLKRFQREARAVVGLNHPNIVTVYEIGEDHSIHYIASELIEGETLRQHLTRGQMELIEAVDIAIQMASALAVAHNAGIVHRDIKPENIMLRPDGYVKVLDFGIAKLAEQEVPATMPKDEALLLVETNLGSVLGTVRYMSPEQASGAPVDKRTDIWSLGVVLYEMVTGHAPFTGDTPREVMTSILEKEPPAVTTYNKHTPADLRQIIGKALRKDRTERYQSVSEMLQALKGLRHKLELKAVPSWLRRAPAPTALVLLLLVAALALALPFYRNWNLTNSSSPEKSIAVLPFENVGEVKDALADGIQDDILTKLASIDDLKVISRTSVMSYRGQRNLPEIARGLHVTYVLEGSVRRTGEMVHLNTQLIDARTDNHIWAQEYDRDVRDIFKIQSDIAQSVAQKLRAYLDSADRQTLQRAASDNVAAFDLYSRAKNLLLYSTGSNSGKQDLMEAAELTNQALAQDARFFQAYCLLGSIHGQLYILGHDHTAARLAMAEEAIARAFQLRPGAAEAHLARAEVLYRGHLDTEGALAELAIARKELPNEPRVAELEGYIKRRLGRYGEALRDLNRAAELDPRNVSLLLQIALSYTYLRRYSDAATVIDRALAIEPSSICRVARARLEFAAKADTRPWHEEIESVRATNPAELRHIADQWLGCALAEHDVAAAKQALIAAGENTPLNAEAIHFPRPFAEGLIARMKVTKSERTLPLSKPARSRRK
jgi:eukaryotic-like serine/threonine-protein kinase